MKKLVCCGVKTSGTGTGFSNRTERCSVNSSMQKKQSQISPFYYFNLTIKGPAVHTYTGVFAYCGWLDLRSG